MNYLINQLMTVDKAFYRHYLEMLLTLNRIHALTPWQMSMLLWRAKIFHIQVLYPELLRISLCTEQEKGRNTLYEGMETERAGENNARMAATAVRGDKTGTVERILMASD